MVKTVWIGNHQAEIASGDDLFAFDFVGSLHGVCAQADVGFTILELRVNCAAGIAIFSFGTAAATYMLKVLRLITK